MTSTLEIPELSLPSLSIRRINIRQTAFVMRKVKISEKRKESENSITKYYILYILMFHFYIFKDIVPEIFLARALNDIKE